MKLYGTITLLLVVAVLIVAPHVRAQQEVKRLEGETAEAFVRRNAPVGSELARPAIETDAWGRTRTVIAFYKVEAKAKDGTPFSQVDGYMFVPKTPDLYQRILINHFEPEGSAPEIRAVFFANADKDPARELVVICSWEQVHYDVHGTLYGTFIFDDVLGPTDRTQLRFLEGTSDKVSGGCDCDYRDGGKGTKKFRTAAQVKAGLRNLGYR